MTAMPAVKLMTAEEFMALAPREDSARVELIEGEVVVSQPAWQHQRTCVRLLFAFEVWTRAAKGRGAVSLPLDVLLDEHNVFVPDILWYDAASTPGRDDKPPYSVPALAVEVRSPSTWRYDIGAKKAVYERRGLRELWLVDTAADVILVFRPSAAESHGFDQSLELGGGDSLTSPLLPGFTLTLDEVFAN